MRKHHPENERVKREYFLFLEQAKRMVTASVDQIAAAITEFEQSTRYKDFRKFNINQAKAFKDRLNAATNPETGKPLAKATIRSRLLALKAFFQWLAGRPGFKSRVSYSDAEYFNPSANDERIATAHRCRPVPTLADIRRVLADMPAGTEIERRDRALIAFAILSGARDDAIASLSIRHIDLAACKVFQDAREVRTKNRKTFTSGFFPIGSDIQEIVSDWIEYLLTERGFGPDDPLFPAAQVGLGDDGLFLSDGLSRRHWKNAGAIRRIFKSAFDSAGLPYANPHSFRTTLGRLGQKLCNTPEECKAWSQNLGHEHVMTTFRSYGSVPEERQTEIFASLRRRCDGQNLRTTDDLDPDTIQRVLDHVKLLTAKT